MLVTLRLACSLIAALLAATSVGAENPMPTPVGVWLHPNERIRIKIAPCGAQLCGKLVWFRWPNDARGLPRVDLMNPNPALRARPLMGLTILSGLRNTGERTWEEGKVYNADDGKNYSAQMSIAGDGTLRVRAYVLVPLIGETQIWTRVH